MSIRIAIPDMISPSYFPAIAAVELGFFEDQGLDAHVELLFPVTDTYAALAAGEIDYVGGSSHAALYEFDDWEGGSLIAALSQNMYWFLVVRSDLEVERGDLHAIEGLRIGAAPGPVDGLKRMLEEVGMDPETDVDIGPVPGTDGKGVSFGVAAAEALETGEVDGFWANGMGAEVATSEGYGQILVDARRGDGPPGAKRYTYSTLATTDRRIEEDPSEVQAVIRGLVDAEQALVDDPSLARKAAEPHFPEYETELIEPVIERDTPFYDAEITPDAVAGMNDFARYLGLLDADDVAYEDVVAAQFSDEWDQH